VGARRDDQPLVIQAGAALLALIAALVLPAAAAAQDGPPRAAAATADLPAVLVSRQLAEQERLAVGSTITLAAQPDGEGGRRVRVAGIYEPAPDPSRLGGRVLETRLHLPDLLDLTRPPETPAGAEHVQSINVALTDPADAERFARDVNRRAPGAVARPAGSARDAGPFLVLERFHLAIAAVTIVAATVFLLALTVMLVDERRETVGVLRLIGLPVRRILAQVLIEGMLVSAAGAAFGVVLALGSEVLINRFFQWRYDTLLVFVRVTPEVAATCLAIAIPLGATATVAASWALLRRNALRLVRR
jgi:ABC-type lipoprotein release transport system permease subunit